MSSARPMREGMHLKNTQDMADGHGQLDVAPCARGALPGQRHFHAATVAHDTAGA